MSSFSYTALRDIMSGHTEGFSYSFDVALTKADRSGDPTRYQSRSLGGVSETYLSMVDTGYKLTTKFFVENSSEHLQMREFLSSIIGGESFNFDRFGSVVVPDDPVECEIVNDKLTEHRKGTENYIGYTFEIRFRISPT